MDRSVLINKGMSSRKKSLIFSILTFLVVVVGVLSATYAYFTASADQQNSYTFASMSLTLKTASGEVFDSDEFSATYNQKLTPGDSVNFSDIKVKNESSVDVYSLIKLVVEITKSSSTTADLTIKKWYNLSGQEVEQDDSGEIYLVNTSTKADATAITQNTSEATNITYTFPTNLDTTYTNATAEFTLTACAVQKDNLQTSQTRTASNFACYYIIDCFSIPEFTIYLDGNASTVETRAQTVAELDANATTGATTCGWFYDEDCTDPVPLDATLTSVPLYTKTATMDMVTTTENSTGLTVTGSTSTTPTGEVIIPQKVNGVQVTEIGASAFSGKTGVTNVIIPEGVTKINLDAFYGCTGITSVTIPSTVTYVAGRSFYNNTSLTSVKIYSEEIDIVSNLAPLRNSNYATTSSFKNCSKLTYNEYDNIYYLGNENNPYVVAMHPKNYSTITTVTFHQDCKSIAQSFSYNAKKLTTINLNEGLLHIGDYAFESRSSITGTWAIPSSVTSIGYRAFYYCSKLTGSLTFSSSMTKIGDYAFYQCTGLTSLTICDESSETTLNTNYTLKNNNNNIKMLSTGDTSTTNCVIGSSAFYKCTSLTKVTLNEGVTSIGTEAFAFCTGISQMSVPSSIEYVGCDAFVQNRGGYSTSSGSYTCGRILNLKNSYHCYDNAYYLGNGTNPYVILMGAVNTSITSCVLADTTKVIYGSSNDFNNNGMSYTAAIENNGFEFCYNLQTLTLNEGLKQIGRLSISGKMTTLNIPSTVNNIYYGYGSNAHAMYSCSSLQTITVANGNQYYEVKDGSLINSTTKALIKGTNTSSIPNDTTAIAYRAFYGCSGVENISLPSTVTNVGVEAFVGCTPNTITVDGANAKYSGEGNNLIEKSTNKLLCGSNNSTIPNGIVSISDGAFINCTSLSSIVFPSTITNIGTNSFYNCSGLTSLTLNEGLQSIPYQAFRGCSSLTGDLAIPNSVTSIRGYAFSYCSNIKNVTMPGVTSLSDYAFAYSGLTGVTFAEGLTTITQLTFQGCSKLTNISISSTVTSIGAYAFSGCTSLVSVVIPSNVKSISASFTGCTNLTSVTLNEGLTTLSSAFSNCSKLSDITIPSTVTSFGNSTFQNCRGLTSVTIPSGVTSIGQYTFSGCTGLTSITLHDGITSIGERAFYNCTGLTSVTLNEGLKTIGKYAFYNCNKITSITIPSTVTTINSYALSKCTSITSIIIPSTVTTISSYAFYNWTSSQTINCVAESKPSGWNSSWSTSCSATIVWGYTGE